MRAVLGLTVFVSFARLIRSLAACSLNTSNQAPKAKLL